MDWHGVKNKCSCGINYRGKPVFQDILLKMVEGILQSSMFFALTYSFFTKVAPYMIKYVIADDSPFIHYFCNAYTFYAAVSLSLSLANGWVGCQDVPKPICLPPLSHYIANSGHKVTKIVRKGTILRLPLFTWKFKNTKDSQKI